MRSISRVHTPDIAGLKTNNHSLAIQYIKELFSIQKGGIPRPFVYRQIKLIRCRERPACRSVNVGNV